MRAEPCSDGPWLRSERLSARHGCGSTEPRFSREYAPAFAATLERACACPLRRSVHAPGASSTSAAQAPWAPSSPAAVFAAAAAAAVGAGWGAEASQGHPEERHAAAATPTPAGRESEPSPSPESRRPGPAPAVPGVEKPASLPRLGLPGHSPLRSHSHSGPPPTPRCAMFKKLKQKVSEEQQQFQQALASSQVLWLPRSPLCPYPSTPAPA